MYGYVATPEYGLTPAGAAGIRGLGCGCAGLGCPCAGLGLFESGTDFSQWGIGEWLVVGVGAYVVFSVLFTTKSAARASVRKGRAVKKALRA